MGLIDTEIQRICKTGPVTRDDEKTRRIILWLVEKVIEKPEEDITIYSVGASPQGCFCLLWKGGGNKCFLVGYNTVVFVDTSRSIHLTYSPPRFKIPHLEYLKKILIDV